MKKIQVAIKGEHEEAVILDILKSVNAAVLAHGSLDVSIQTETVGGKEIRVPDFLQPYCREGRDRHVTTDSATKH